MARSDLDLVKAAACGLSEHFDSVQIITTRHTAEGTESIRYGRGNWYARVASVREFLVKDNEESRVQVRKENEDE